MQSGTTPTGQGEGFHACSALSQNHGDSRDGETGDAPLAMLGRSKEGSKRESRKKWQTCELSQRIRT